MTHIRISIRIQYVRNIPAVRACSGFFAYICGMACTTEFIDRICETLAPLGEVRHRKMMGDYVIYLNDKCVITACDNCAFIKKLECIAPLMADAETGSPYEGAKEAYILDFSRRQHALQVIATLWEALPMPKKKKS